MPLTQDVPLEITITAARFERDKHRAPSTELGATFYLQWYATIVRGYHYDSHDQLRQHVGDFVAAHNFGRRLKTLTPYEAICKTWQNEPYQFLSNPHHQMPGSNT